MSQTPLKFAVVGCGHIGKRHAEMVRRNTEAELVGMIDVRPIEELNIEQYEAPYFNSISEFMDAGIDVDVICVCSPNGMHAEHSLEALDHRKHVVCEKPMALTKAGCEKIIFKSLQMRRQVFCVMQNRFSPPSVWLKELIDNGSLGEIFMVDINCYWNRDERYYKSIGWKGTSDMDGGTLFTQFSHFIDIMYWLFGDVENITGRFADFNHKDITEFEDSGVVSFDFINGGVGSLNYSTSVWGQNLESSMTIIGSKGSVKVGGQYMNEVEYCNVENYEMPELPEASPANDYGTYKGSAANHHFIIQNVVDTLKNRNVATTNALEGLKVVDIIERIYKVRDSNKG